MVYWNLEQERKKSTNCLAEALERKEIRKAQVGQNTVANNYNTQKEQKINVNLAKIKPVLGHKYPSSLGSSLYIFKDHENGI